MFTGLITHLGRVESIVALAAGQRVRIASNMADGSLRLGESISVDGCCLTVTAQERGWFETELSPETLARTTAAAWQPGTLVNLERALRLGDRLGGHWVQGHIDGVGEIIAVQSLGEVHELDVAIPPNLRKYMVKKGSVAIAGVSLTINRRTRASIGLTIIPHTWENTTLAHLVSGARVNVEVDIIAKHLAALAMPYRTLGQNAGARKGRLAKRKKRS